MGAQGTPATAGRASSGSGTSGLLARPPGTGTFLPILWDPIRPAIETVVSHTWEPVRRRFHDSLAAVADLSGMPAPNLSLPEVAAFYFTLMKVLSSGIPMTEKRRSLFLQSVAASTYTHGDPGNLLSPREYWDFLQARHVQYAQAARSAQGTKPLITFIDHFLCQAGLGGSDNADVVFGLYRFLSPLLAETAYLLREAAGPARGREDSY
ncbi:MAG: hypothetical protein SCH98_10485 [Deferrisomatales bacterium]|nr:hypothetical protein [Deferrisomatales bacterium]